LLQLRGTLFPEQLLLNIVVKRIVWVTAAAFAAVVAAGCLTEFPGGGPPPDAAPPECGNGVMEAGEGCDGTDLGGETCLTAGDHEHGQLACAADCTLDTSDCHTCGDGLIEGPEDCDDANTETGDGCDGTCMVERGWACSGEPSVCITVCGDGITAGGEECDDGNDEGGDGCDANCSVEDFFACDGEPSVCVCVVYVDVDNETPNPDGASWTRAFTQVQPGIDNASTLLNTQGTCEVWVAAGNYFIYQLLATDTVQLASHVGVYGGFTGVETARGQRDWELNPTVLDGGNQALPGVRVNRVVSAVDVMDATLSGFTVTRGSATGSGGGLGAMNSVLYVEYCRFEDNQAAVNGGAIYLVDAPNETHIADSTFVQNSAGENGGAIAVLRGDPTIKRCTFQLNQAGTSGGGGVDCQDGSCTVKRSVFVANDSEYGGGFSSQASTADVVNCVFVNNTADRGAAVNGWNGATILMRNCTLFQNGAATAGGGARINGGSYLIENSIIRANLPENLFIQAGTITANYSDVEGGYVGQGNIDADPLFVDAVNRDFHLQPGSPCIDAGYGNSAPVMDFDGNPHVDDPNTPDTGAGTPPWVDMGPFEYQP
jgi:cysteine-rich repeat protein/predicted outer membrane repeat protein